MWNFISVLFILLGENHILDAVSVCGNAFLFNASNGQNETLEGNLSGHRKIILDSPIGEQGNQGGGDGDSCTRAIFRDSSRREVDMKVKLLEDKFCLSPFLFEDHRVICEVNPHRFRIV